MIALFDKIYFMLTNFASTALQNVISEAIMMIKYVLPLILVNIILACKLAKLPLYIPELSLSSRELVFEPTFAPRTKDENQLQSLYTQTNEMT